MRKLRLASAAAALLAVPAPAAAQDAAGGLADVTACIERNIPRTSSEQIVEFTSVDRVGGERVSRSKIIAKRFSEDGLRRLMLRFTKPVDMRGSSVLMVETESGANDMFVYTPELRKVKRVTADGVGGSLFGTDFSFEDFERWQNLNKPGKQTRAPDATVEDRPVFVLQSAPEAESGSAYETIVSYIDKETCVVLKSESFEAGRVLRKRLTASPDSVIEQNGIHAATEVLMEDVRDETHTTVIVEDLEIDRDIPDKEFTISRLTRRR
jgi:hypothetical protein